MLIACVDTLQKDSLPSRLNDQRKAGQFCDVLLKVAGLTLPTHGCVLSASSAYFRGLICDVPTSNRLDPLEIHLDTLDEVGPLMVDSPEAVAELVDYFYTGKINVRGDGVELVVKLAETFRLDSLLTLIRKCSRSTSGGGKPESRTTVGGEVANETTTVRRRPLRKVITLPVRHHRKVPPRKLTVVTETEMKRKRKCLTPVRLEIVPDVAVSDQGSDGECLVQSPTTVVAKRVKRGVAPVRIKRVVAPIRVKVGLASAGLKAAACKFKCKQCSFVSRDAKTIRAHKLSHPGLQYSCCNCDLVTAQCSQLLEHMLKADHPQSRCSLCEFESEDLVAFRTHVERHDPKKPFFCGQCDFKCGSRSQLSAHTMKHSTERPFVCDVCKRGFKWKKGLQTHMLSHSKEKAFMCDQCDFRTAYSSVLAMHLRIHNGEMLTCPHDGCYFQAYSKRHIAKHGLTHNKDKPYVCEVCGQKYAQIESLRRHSRVHNPDTKILRCDQCQYATTRRDKMTDHSKKSHCADRSNTSATSTTTTNNNSNNNGSIKPTASDQRPPRKPSSNRAPRSDLLQQPRRSSANLESIESPRTAQHYLTTKSRNSDSLPADNYVSTSAGIGDSHYSFERLQAAVRASEQHNNNHHVASTTKRHVTEQQTSSRDHHHHHQQQHHHHHHASKSSSSASASLHNLHLSYEQQQTNSGDGSGWTDAGNSGSAHYFVPHGHPAHQNHHHYHLQRESTSTVAAMLVTTHLGLMDMAHP